MIENTFIKKITAGILRNRKMTIVERNIMHPERDWLLGIFVGAVVVAVAAIWSVNTYVQFKNISVTSSIESPDAIIYKEHLVNTALAGLSKRKATYELLKQDLINKKATIFMEVPVVVSPGEVIEEEVPEIGISDIPETQPREGAGEVIKME